MNLRKLDTLDGSGYGAGFESPDEIASPLWGDHFGSGDESMRGLGRGSCEGGGYADKSGPGGETISGGGSLTLGCHGCGCGLDIYEGRGKLSGEG